MNVFTIETPEAAAAEKLGFTIETIAEDLQAPIEISPLIHQQKRNLTGFNVCPLVPDSTVEAGATPEASAMAIAHQVDIWSQRLAKVADAIRERFPTR